MSYNIIKSLTRSAVIAAAVAVVACLSVSCSKTGQETDPEPGVIKLNAKIAPTKESSSKAGPIVDGTELKDVCFYHIQLDEATYEVAFKGASLGDISTTGEVKHTTRPHYYDLQYGRTSVITGWYPAAEVQMADPQNMTLMVLFDIDGKSDILLTRDPLMCGTYTNPYPNGSQLVFTHALSRIEVICRADSELTLDELRTVWGKIEKIELCGSTTQVMIDMMDVRSHDNSDEVEFPLLKGDYSGAFTPIDLPESTSTDITAAAMVSPTVGRSDVDGIFVLRITTSNGGTQDLGVFMGESVSYMESGMTYRVTLMFSKFEIIAQTATVAEWNDPNDNKIEIIK